MLLIKTCQLCSDRTTSENVLLISLRTFCVLYGDLFVDFKNNFSTNLERSSMDASWTIGDD